MARLLTPRCRGAGLLVLLGLGSPACAEELAVEGSGRPDIAGATSESTSDDDGGVSQLQLELDEVQYALAWAPFDAGGELQAGDVFELTTDLGYRVRVQSAHLVVRGMSLVDCGSPLVAQPELALLAAAGAQTKSDGAVLDPTSVYHGYVEDLAVRETAEFGAQSFDAQLTCGVHFVLAQASPTALNMPDEPDMLSRSLLLQGIAQRDEGGETGGAGEPIEFSIDIHHADGLVTAWDDASVDFAGGPVARVVVVRDLNTAFDGIEFETATQMQLDISVLHNLATHARIRVEDPA